MWFVSKILASFAFILVTVQLLLPSAQTLAADELSFLMWKPDHPEVWHRAIETFEKQYHIKVNVRIGPHSSTAAHALVTQKLKNQDPDPDVFLMDVIWPPEFVSAGWIQPLDEFFPVKAQADFFPAAIAACTFEDKIYGVPSWTSGGLLYYRRDLLEKYGYRAPETWDELVAQAERIVSQERAHNPALKGYSGQFKQDRRPCVQHAGVRAEQRGKLFDRVARKSVIDSPANVAAILYVRDKIVGKCASRAVLTYQEPESLHVFIQGHAVFLRNWPYAWEIANNPDASRVAGKVGITVLPHFPGGESVSTLGGWQFALSRFSRKKTLAWQFIRYMSSPSVQKTFALDASQTPARRSVYQDPEVLRRNPHFAELRKVFEKARGRPAIPLYPLYSHILQSFYQNALVYPHSHVDALAAEADERVGWLLKVMKEGGM